MYFAGEYSKFNEGEVVTLEGKQHTIKTIGILGGKLSNHCFLYHLEREDGKQFDVAENVLINLTNKCDAD